MILNKFLAYAFALIYSIAIAKIKMTVHRNASSFRSYIYINAKFENFHSYLQLYFSNDTLKIKMLKIPD